MENNSPFDSEGLSRRTILEALGGGGTLAGLNSIISGQAAASSDRVPESGNIMTTTDEFDIEPSEMVTTLTDSMLDQYGEDFLDEITDAFDTAPGDIASALSSLVTDVPDVVDTLDWLGDKLGQIRGIISSFSLSDDDDSSSGNNSVSAAPDEIVGSTVTDNVASSGSVSPSSGSHSIWHSVRSAVPDALGDIESALGNQDLWGLLTSAVSGLDDKFDPDDLAEIIKNPMEKITEAADEVLSMILYPLDSLQDIFAADRDTLQEELTGEFNITEKLNLPDGVDDVVQSFEPLRSAVLDEVDSSGSSVENMQGFSTSHAPSSGSEDARQNVSEENAGESGTPISLHDFIDYDSSTATKDRPRSSVGVPNPKHSAPGNTTEGDRYDLTPSGLYQQSSPSDFLYPSNESAICGSLPGRNTYNASRPYDNFNQYARDGVDQVINEIYSEESEGVDFPGEPGADLYKPCPVAPQGEVAAGEYRLKLSNLGAIFQDGNESCASGDFSAGVFIGVGHDQCIYVGLDPTAVPASAYTEYLQDMLTFAINGAMYGKGKINNILGSANVYTGYQDFCARYDFTDTDVDGLTVGELEHNVDTLFSTLRDIIDTLEQKAVEKDYAFMDFANADDTEDIVKKYYSFNVDLDEDEDEAPDRFNFARDGIDTWENYADCNIAALKSAFLGEDLEPQCDILGGEFNTDGSDSIYVAIAQLYNNISESEEIESSEIPTELEVIGQETQTLLTDSPQWESVPLSLLCVDKEEMQVIRDFIDSDVENSSDITIPSELRANSSDDSANDPLFDIVDGIAKRHLGTLINHIFVQLLEKLCVKLTNFAAIKRWSGLGFHSRAAKTFARVTEALRFVQGTSACKKVGCRNVSVPAPLPYGYLERTSGKLYDPHTGQRPRMNMHRTYDDVGGGNEGLLGVIAAVVITIIVLYIAYQTAGSALLSGSGLSIFSTESVKAGATIAGPALVFADAHTKGGMLEPDPCSQSRIQQ